jgi:signal peptidase II
VTKKYISLSAAIVFLLDQATKMILTADYPHLVSYNSGIAFGIPVPLIVLYISIPVLLLFLLHIFLKILHVTRVQSLFFGFIFGGGFSNYIDRIGDGLVTDFIDLGWWPSFNVADSFIVIGVVGLIVLMLQSDHE